MPPEPLQQIDRTWVQWRGSALAYFGGCDYFRMASHPEVLAAARDAISTYGLNVAASRYTTGNHILYDELELALAAFFQVESALLVANGYLTNLAVIKALVGQFTHILIDEQAHFSLVDAAASVPFAAWVFDHRNPESLRKRIEESAREGNRPLLLTDGLFAHNGQTAPLKEYAEILPSNSWMMVDDSHGAGTLGHHGRGTLELLSFNRPNVIQTATLSKAFGSFGGVILSKSAVREQIEEGSVIRGATPAPLPCAAAALASTRLLKKPDLRESLRRNAARVGAASPGPILSIVPRDEPHRLRIYDALLAHGIFPSQIRYQTKAYFRFAISSEHTRAQLDALASALKEA